MPWEAEKRIQKERERGNLGITQNFAYYYYLKELTFLKSCIYPTCILINTTNYNPPIKQKNEKVK